MQGTQGCRGHKSKSQRPGLQTADAGKGSHFLKNFISTANKSYGPSTVSARLANTYHSSKLNNNNSKIIVSASQDEQRGSTAGR